LEALLTLKEAAEILHYSTRQMHKIIRTDPTFPARRLGGKGHFRINPTELEAWRKNQPTWIEARVAEVATKRKGRPTLSGTFPRAIAK
jgi:hypothetical protein